MSYEVITVLAFVLAIVGTILLGIMIMPERKRITLNKFGKVMHDIFNFKGLLIESVLKYIYVFATCYTIGLGFFALFWTREYYSGGGLFGATSSTEWMGYYGLIVLVVGPIAIRLAFETMMMFILLVKNTIQINNKLKNQNGDAGNASAFGEFEMPKFTPKAPKAPQQPYYQQPYQQPQYQVPQQPQYQAPQQPQYQVPQQPQYQAPQQPQYQAPQQPQYQAPINPNAEPEQKAEQPQTPTQNF